MEYVLRTLWYALLLLVVARLLNRRTLVSEKPSDFAVNVTYGTLAGTGIASRGVPVWGGTLAIATLTLFAWALNTAGSRYRRMAGVLAGRPITLVRTGRPLAHNPRRIHMTAADLGAKLRDLKQATLGDVELAFLETDGRIGVVPRPHTPPARQCTPKQGGGPDPLEATASAPLAPTASSAVAPGFAPVRITHSEHHFQASATVRDIVLGMSDGLTVPFALAAGLSGTVATTRIIIVAGLAEIAAGSIAMGLGGYLASKTDVEHYLTERGREQAELRDHPEEEVAEVVQIFAEHGVGTEAAGRVAEELRSHPTAWLDFLMRFELGLERPDPRRAVRSAGTIAASYVVGGLLPLSPYFFLSHVPSALAGSVSVTLLALLIFGGVKGRFTGTNPARSGLQTALIGGLAAAAAFLIAKAIS